MVGQTALGLVKAAFSRYPPLYEAAYRIAYSRPRASAPPPGDLGTAGEVFREIWRSDFWNKAGEDQRGDPPPGTRSGYGSSLDQTADLRRALPKLAQELAIATLLDAPCGDLHWMESADLGGVRYIGADIVVGLINELKLKYPEREFRVLDLAHDALPKVDLVMCRDCFIHLPNDMVISALNNFTRSGSKYLLTTTYRFPRVNREISIGGFRRVNLEIAPFFLPRPIRIIRDYRYPAGPHFMGLWSRDQVVSTINRRA